MIGYIISTIFIIAFMIILYKLTMQYIKETSVKLESRDYFVVIDKRKFSLPCGVKKYVIYLYTFDGYIPFEITKYEYQNIEKGSFKKVLVTTVVYNDEIFNKYSLIKG